MILSHVPASSQQHDFDAPKPLLWGFVVVVLFVCLFLTYMSWHMSQGVSRQNSCTVEAEVVLLPPSQVMPVCCLSFAGVFGFFPCSLEISGC